MFDDSPYCVAAREAELAKEAAERQELKKGEGVRDTAPGAKRDSSTATTIRDSSTGTTTRDTVPGTTRDSSTGSAKRETAPGKNAILSRVRFMHWVTTRVSHKHNASLFRQFLVFNLSGLESIVLNLILVVTTWCLKHTLLFSFP
jgi:hypothetical protein